MNKKITRRVFVATGGTALVLACTGLWSLDNYITSFTSGSITSSGLEENPLFAYLPSLREHLPWIKIGAFPTPVHELGTSLGLRNKQLFVKRDDISSVLYGGNKIRKLEYLLAEANITECDTLLTIGGSGSNHALTTAIMGKAFGKKVELFLHYQPMSDHVKENIKGFLSAGATLHYSAKMSQAYFNAQIRFRDLKKAGRKPYFIMSGGTCGLSNFGYLGAVLELKNQLEAVGEKFPDSIFVPVGTCGTISGMVAGVKLLGLKTKIFGVKIFDSFPANSFMIKYYSQIVLDQIKNYSGENFGKVSDEQFLLLKDYIGKGYGIPTKKSRECVKMAEPVLHLENTYTGKTLAACIDYCKTDGKNKKVLFWNTFNSQPFRKTESFFGIPPELTKQFL